MFNSSVFVEISATFYHIREYLKIIFFQFSRIISEITTLAALKREPLVKGNIIITLSKKNNNNNKTKQFEVVKIFTSFSPDLL